VSVAQTVTTAFVIEGVSVFVGERVSPNTNVVIEGGFVRAVGSQIPKRWRHLPVIRGAGATEIVDSISSL
jgi:hypothetical protein